MTHLKKNFYFKTTAMILVFLFIFQADVLISSSLGKTMDSELKNAKKEYLAANFSRAEILLKRLEMLYKNTKNKSQDIEQKYGETLLLLAACWENTRQEEEHKIKETYNLAKEKLRKGFTFSDLDLSQLKIYRKTFQIEMVEKNDQGTIIERESQLSPSVRKKKFPWLLAIGGVVVVTFAVILLLSKKPKRTLTVSVGEGVDGAPASGTTTYKNGATVSYNYTLKSGYSGLVVKCDGFDVSASGTIKMDKNHTLTASASKTYTLTVIRGVGVNGTPDSGTYSYNDGDTVNYGYSLQNGYTGLVVKLDGLDALAAGSIIMTRDHTLTVESAKLYTLTVTKGTGVIGLPETGTYSYKDGDTLNYNYGVQEGYANLLVTLDGSPAPGSGFITMANNHTLTASATAADKKR